MPSSNLTPLWLRNGHVQTLLPKILRHTPKLNLRRERVELQDGDFIDLDHSLRCQGPRILILHGLEGSMDSHYAGPLVEVLEQRGFRPVFMYLRGCSEETNRLARSYHSGSSDDLHEVLNHLYVKGTPIQGAVGFSLGGNILLKYLGEQGNKSLLTAAMAISVPLHLEMAAKRLTKGASRIYQRYLLNKLRRTWIQKKRQHQELPDIHVNSLRTLEQYDDHITAPINGFSNAKTYYSTCSAANFLKDITVPTYILLAKDDPFMYPLQQEDYEIPPHVRLEMCAHGGHVGFIAGTWPWRIRYLLDEYIPDYFEKMHLKHIQ
ncbi:hydrolase [Desulfogranum japonicum]|uniref:hydrolase n=1 Tax=Desulfogranum japonicum TaxID=231447 RepID=UPI000422C362|nr:hydrolase [Desulfogranum japonicum]